MNILFPVSECVPFAKTGGLADVAGSLPNALKALGHHAVIVMPFYQQVKKTVKNPENMNITLNVAVGSETISGSVYKTQLGQDGCDVYFIKNDGFFDRPALYQTQDGDYEDNDKRFVFFDRAVLELGKKLNRTWDVIHCHDWHTGLIPVYLKTLYRDEMAYRASRSVITIHNLAYQGHFEKASYSLTGFPEHLFDSNGLEFWGGFNFLKAGLMYADKINTVSETYAREITTPEFGCGLDGVLNFRKEDLLGILNGIDYSEWDPETDPHLPVKFRYGQWEKKR